MPLIPENSIQQIDTIKASDFAPIKAHKKFA